MIAIVICIIVAVFVGIQIERNTPSKEVMNIYEYFGVKENDSMFIVDGEILEEYNFLSENGMIYIPYEFVTEYFNDRFYLDEHLNEILYTVADNIYYYSAESKVYKDMNGVEETLSGIPVKIIGEEVYMSVELALLYSDFWYKYYENPSRLYISDKYGSTKYVGANKDTWIRYEANVKSPIVKDIKTGDTCIFIEETEKGWYIVESEDGITGYVKKKFFDAPYEVITESSFACEVAPVTKSFDKKINLTWHAVGAVLSADKVKSALAQTKGVNVISPTWYKILDNNGNISSFAGSDYVKGCHEMGVMVWPLWDDFTNDVDGYEVYSDRNTRKKMIDYMINDAAKYGFDGINVDFEKVNNKSAAHFIQFLRELSISCRQNNLILSVDNYVPAEYNLHYDREEQAYWVDYIVIMGYDEHYSGSDAGSVASMGFTENGIVNTLKEVPASKIISGMPFYTRIWLETTNKDGSITTTSKAVGMETAYKTVKESGFPAIWDEECGQYYCSYDYADGNSVVKIWLEDVKSIEERMKLFKNYNLAGVASWRLGFETESVWDVILKYLN